MGSVTHLDVMKINTHPLDPKGPIVNNNTDLFIYHLFKGTLLPFFLPKWCAASSVYGQLAQMVISSILSAFGKIKPLKRHLK